MRCLDCPELTWPNGRPIGCLPRLTCCGSAKSNVTTNNLTQSEIELQARELLDRNVSRQVRRRIARKGL